MVFCLADNEESARILSQSVDVMGTEGKVALVDVICVDGNGGCVVFDTLNIFPIQRVDMKSVPVEQIRQRALSKLSEAERAALGLSD